MQIGVSVRLAGIGFLSCWVLLGAGEAARADLAPPVHRSNPVGGPASSGRQAPVAPPTSATSDRGGLTDVLVAGAPPIPAGQTDNYPDNVKDEPTIARDPVTGRFVASAIDYVVFNHFFNSGISAVYKSPDAVNWSHPSFAAGSTPDCQWSSDVLPGYCDLGYYSAGDVTAAFGPRQDGAGHFSFANGARAYISNDIRDVSFTSPRGPGIAVSHSDDDGASWVAPTVVATPSTTFDSDKSVVWADANPSSPCFGSVYDAWTQYYNGNTPQERGPVLVARSTDGANSFSAPLTVTPPGSTEDTAVGGVRTLSDGTVIVAWGSFGSQATATGSGPSSIEVALSHDCGRHFGAPVTVAQFTQGHGVSTHYRVPGTHFRVSSFPSLDAQGTHAYATWTETDATGALVVRAARSLDGGSRWSAPHLVSDPRDGNAFMPAVGAADGRVIISYANVIATSPTPGPGVASIGMLYAIGDRSAHTFRRHALSSRSGDPDGTDGFVGDYTSVIVSGRGEAARAYPIWTDDRDAVPCAAADADPNFDVNHGCAAGWGTSEIRAATVTVGDGGSGDGQP